MRDPAPPPGPWSDRSGQVADLRPRPPAAEDPGLEPETLAVGTFVVARQGHWEVDLVMVLADRLVGHRFGPYQTEPLARQAAAWLEAAVERAGCP
jgi:hypothetical protein